MHSASMADKAPDQDLDGPSAPDRAITDHQTIRHGAADVAHPASWKIEIVVDSDEWEGDPCRFETRSEALAYARSLAFRCSAVRDWRVVPSPDPVNRGRLLRRQNDGGDVVA